MSAESLGDLSARYVTPGHRPMYLMAGNFRAIEQRQRDEFVAELVADSRQISTEELAVLLRGETADQRLVAAWLAGTARQAAMRDLIVERLHDEELHGPAQGYCLALARFGTEQDGRILAGYLDDSLPMPAAHMPMSQDWALGALMHIDATTGGRQSAGYVEPDGPWDRYLADARLSRQYSAPEAVYQLIATLCALLDAHQADDS